MPNKGYKSTPGFCSKIINFIFKLISRRIRLQAAAILGAKSYPKPLAKRVEFIAVDVTAHMTIQRALLLISIILILFGCEKKQSELEFEQSVAYEIFPALMDSLHYDSRLKPPPPPKAIYDEQGKYVGFDTTEAEQLIADHHKKIAELKADSMKLVMAINDSTSRLSAISKSNLIGHFYKQELKLDTLNITESYKIDLNRLNADKKLIFRYRSEFPNGLDLWRKKDSFNINATTWISRIQFDLNKTYGVLESGISCGIYCGRAVRVFIKKENDNWIIDEIVDYGEVS